MKKIIVIFIIVICLVRIYILDIMIIKGQSMEPTLSENQIVLVNKRYNELKNGDVIIFEVNDSKYIKRIFACEGEKIVCEKDSFIIKNEKISVGNYVNKVYIGKELNINNDEFFVIGDNIEESIDSRYFGAINRDSVIGKIINIK